MTTLSVPRSGDSPVLPSPSAPNSFPAGAAVPASSAPSPSRPDYSPLPAVWAHAVSLMAIVVLGVALAGMGLTFAREETWVGCLALAAAAVAAVVSALAGRGAAARLSGQLRRRFPEVPVLVVIRTPVLRAQLTLLSSQDRVRLGRFVGVTVHEQGVAIWRTGGDREPLQWVSWAEVSSLVADRESVDMVPVPALVLSGHNAGLPFRLPLPMANPRTGLPLRRALFGPVAEQVAARHNAAAGVAGSTLPVVRPSWRARLAPALALVGLGAVITVGYIVRPAASELLANAVAAVAPAAPAAAGGVLYTPEDASFRVEFPGEPTAASYEQPVMGMTMPITTATWQEGDEMLVATATDLTAMFGPGVDFGAITAEELDLMLQSGLDGAVANLPGSTMLDQAFGELDGARTIEATVEVDGSELDLVVLFSDGVAYALGASGDEELKRGFVDSFRLLGAAATR